MHKCHKCGKPSSLYIGRANFYVCSDCFKKYYKEPKPISSEIPLNKIGLDKH